MTSRPQHREQTRPAFRRDSRGATAAEFALILPMFLLLVLGIIEVGRMLSTKNTLQYAVERAARCAVIGASPCATPAQVQSYAASLVYGSALGGAVFSSTAPACGQEVSASLPYTPILPIPMNVTLTAQSCRPG